MKGINDYKKRFNVLLESTMGDVKPLIFEQGPEQALYQMEDFCKTQRETLKKLLRNSEIPSECIIGDDEDKCIMAVIRIAGEMNLSGKYTDRLNLNTVKNAGYALFNCNKEHEPKKGPQVPERKNPLDIGSKEPETVG